MAETREALEFLNAPLGIITAGQPLQIISNELVETLTEGVRFLSRTCHQLLVDG